MYMYISIHSFAAPPPPTALQVATILVVEAGIFPLMCGWWIDICSFVSRANLLHVHNMYMDLKLLIVFLRSSLSDSVWFQYEEQAGESGQSYWYTT